MNGFELPRPLDWMLAARCAEIDTELFFPEPGRSVKSAKKICDKCEVRDDCLEWALRTGEKWGVLGGKGEKERRELRKKRRRHGPRTKCPVCSEAMLESSIPRHMQRRHDGGVAA